MPLSSQLARGLAPAGRRLLGMGVAAPMYQQRGGLLGMMASARYMASATAAAVRFVVWCVWLETRRTCVRSSVGRVGGWEYKVRLID